MRVLDLDNRQETVMQDSRQVAQRVTLSPDGRWLVASDLDETRFLVWDAQSGHRINELASGKVGLNAARLDATFSPDSRWLVTGADREFRFWKTGSWQLKYRRPAASIAHHAAFAPDGRMVAIPYSRYLVRLLDVASGREIATLEPPHPEYITWLCFTPDATRLAVAYQTHGIHLWDLRLIREQLAELGLDWDMPAYPPVQRAAESEPLRIELSTAN